MRYLPLILIAGLANAQTVTTYHSRFGIAPVQSEYLAVDIAITDPIANPNYRPLYRNHQAPALIDTETRIGVRITGTVAQAEADLQRAIAAIPLTPMEQLARRLATQIVLQDELSEEEITWLADLHAPWAPGRTVAVDEIYRHEGQLYRVVQAHTTQSDWPPPVVPALFARIAPPDVVAPWVQPAGAHDAYQVGDRVTHNGATWKSTAANNVWAPGVYGWVQIGE